MRQEWAVTAATHQLEAIRAIQSAGRDGDARLAVEWAEMSYSRLTFAIGTVPLDRLDYVREMTVEQGRSLADALEEVGA